MSWLTIYWPQSFFFLQNYPDINFPVVSLSVCLFVCFNFTKPVSNRLGKCTCPRACIAHEARQATFVLFCYFFCQIFCHSEDVHDWKWKTNKCDSPGRYWRDTTFLFYAFLLFRQEIIQNGQNGSKNCQNTTFFAPGGPNMELRKRVINVKVLPCPPISCQPTEAFRIGPEAHSGGPKTQHWPSKQCRIWRKLNLLKRVSLFNL